LCTTRGFSGVGYNGDEGMGMDRRVPVVVLACFLVTALLLTGCPYLPFGEAVYVNVGNPNARRDGRTWNTAYHTIQAGIDKAKKRGVGEVWVVGGVYDERREERSGAVVMQDGVDVYGGFVGNETSRSQRDPVAHVTVIDGAQGRNREPAYHVIIGANATLDGFTITGGIAQETDTPGDEGGGGMFNPGVSPTVVDCIFENNTALQGGAIFRYDATLTIAN